MNDKVIEELQKKIRECEAAAMKEDDGTALVETSSCFIYGMASGLEDAIKIINDEKTEDIEPDSILDDNNNLENLIKENIDSVLFDLDGVAVKGATSHLTVEDVKEIAREFYRLGMNDANRKAEREPEQEDKWSWTPDMLKFKVGDRVNLNNRDDAVYNILTIDSVNMEDECYVCNQGTVIKFDYQIIWHKVDDEKETVEQ